MKLQKVAFDHRLYSEMTYTARNFKGVAIVMISNDKQSQLDMINLQGIAAQRKLVLSTLVSIALLGIAIALTAVEMDPINFMFYALALVAGLITFNVNKYKQKIRMLRKELLAMNF